MPNLVRKFLRLTSFRRQVILGYLHWFKNAEFLITQILLAHWILLGWKNATPIFFFNFKVTEFAEYQVCQKFQNCLPCRRISKCPLDVNIKSNKLRILLRVTELCCTTHFVNLLYWHQLVVTTSYFIINSVSNSLFSKLPLSITFQILHLWCGSLVTSLTYRLKTNLLIIKRNNMPTFIKRCQIYLDKDTLL